MIILLNNKIYIHTFWIINIIFSIQKLRDLPFCVDFVHGRYDDVYSKHGGIVSGYIASDYDCEQ